jgi:hypothetical protein
LEWVHRRSSKFRMPREHAYHLVGIRPTADAVMTPDQMVGICRRLQRDKGIYVAVRCGAFRISPYTDNTGSDVVALCAALDEALMWIAMDGW